MNTTVEKIIILPIVVMLLFAMTLIFLNHLTPYIYYTKISDIARKHVTAVEESGGLTAEEKEKILNELQSRGIPRAKVVIASSPELDLPVPYGNPVSITITFKHELEDITSTTDGTTFRLHKSVKNLPIVIGKTGISKLSQE